MSRVPHFPEAAEGWQQSVICHQKERLLSQFLTAIRELLAVQQEQLQAVISGDSDFGRFDVLLHLAVRRKQTAKYAYFSHVEAHGCETQSEADADCA